MIAHDYINARPFTEVATIPGRNVTRSLSLSVCIAASFSASREPRASFCEGPSHRFRRVAISTASSSFALSAFGQDRDASSWVGRPDRSPST
jgi:hypothetical protein